MKAELNQVQVKYDQASGLMIVSEWYSVTEPEDMRGQEVWLQRITGGSIEMNVIARNITSG